MFQEERFGYKGHFWPCRCSLAIEYWIDFLLVTLRYCRE